MSDKSDLYREIAAVEMDKATADVTEEERRFWKGRCFGYIYNLPGIRLTATSQSLLQVYSGEMKEALKKAQSFRTLPSQVS